MGNRLLMQMESLKLAYLIFSASEQFSSRGANVTHYESFWTGHIYFGVLELIKGDIERFNQADFNTIEKLESLLLDIANGKTTLPDESLSRYLGNGVDKYCYLR